MSITQVCISFIADAGSLYMLSSEDSHLFEVKAFEEDFHSWFVGQTVQRGQFYSNNFWANKSNEPILRFSDGSYISIKRTALTPGPLELATPANMPSYIANLFAIIIMPVFNCSQKISPLPV